MILAAKNGEACIFLNCRVKKAISKERYGVSNKEDNGDLSIHRLSPDGMYSKANVTLHRITCHNGLCRENCEDCELTVRRKDLICLCLFRTPKTILSLCLIGALLLTVTAKRVRVAIIGAGISGLTAGLKLVDSDRFHSEDIFIYEANTVVGGRMHSRLWSPNNQTSEWCGEFIDSDHTTMFGLVKRFNIQLLDTIAATNAQYHTTFYFLNRFYNETQAWIDYQAIAGTLKEQIRRIGEVNYNQSNADGRYFDNLSLYDWIEQYVPNGHRSPLGEYIDSAYVQEYGLDTKELSSLVFHFTISPDTQPANGPLSIYGLSDQRYRMIGGNEQLPKKISDHLVKRGVSVRFNHNLTRIVKLRNGKIRLTFANNRVATFDHVILTLPVTTLRYVDYRRAQFDPVKKRLIRELRYGTNTKLNLQFSRRFWYDVSSDGVIYTDLPFLDSWEESLGQPGDTGILVLFTGRAIHSVVVLQQSIETFLSRRI